MPSWKKVILSGSNAALNTLTVSNGITGSLLGTATTASYVLNAVSASFAISASRAVSASRSDTASLAVTASFVAAPGSTTQVVYNNGGVLAANSGFVYSGNNVGIGESSPGARLEVKGAGATSATTAFRVENSSAATSMVVLDDGDVGVGTASPGFKLTVDTTNAVDGIALNGTNNFAYVIQANGATKGYIPAYPTTPGAFSTDSLVGDLVYRIETGSSQRFLFNMNGGAGGSTLALTGSRVGINTATPTLASLTVNGNVWANSYTGSLQGTASFAVSASSSISSSYALTASYALNGGGGGIEVTDDGADIGGPFTVINFTGSGVAATDGGGGIVNVFIASSGSGGGGTPGGSDGQVQYNNGGSFGGAVSMSYDDTNHRVGIGTNTPTHTLTVKGDFNISGSLIDALGQAGSDSQSLTSVAGELIWAQPPATARGDHEIDATTPYTPPGGWDNVFINGGYVRVASPVTIDGSYKLVAIVTIGLQNNTGTEQLVGLSFRLYNGNTLAALTATTHHYASFMSKDVDVNMTVFTFHIPIILAEVSESEEIYLQADTSTLPTPDIYYGALTLMKIRA